MMTTNKNFIIKKFIIKTIIKKYKEVREYLIKEREEVVL